MNTRSPHQLERKIITLPRRQFATLPLRAQFDPHKKAEELESKYALRKAALMGQIKELNIHRLWMDKKRAGSFALAVLFLASVIIPSISFDQKVSAASQGPLSAASTSDCVNVAGANIDWTNPGNAFSSNNTRATATNLDGTTSDPLRCTNFSFTIPAGATIDGIVVEVERHATANNNGGVVDSAVNIVKGGSSVGTNKASATVWPTPAGSEAYATYGGTTDLWGTTWTASDINATNFGAQIAATKTSGGGAGIDGLIDHTRITVYYTPAPIVNSFINQNGYIWENDDSANSGTAQAAGNGLISGVRQGERASLRMHIKNTGSDPLTTNLGLFYDKNDGNFVKVQSPNAKQTTGSGCTQTEWSCSAIDSTNNVGWYTSLAFSPTGTPHVAYYDSTNFDLRLAQYVGSGGTGCATAAWTCVTIDSTNSVGQYPSLAFSPDGRPYISYRYATGADLRVAQYVGSGGTGCATVVWTCTSIDTANSVDNYSSIAFSPGGTPYVSFYITGGTNDLRVAQYVGSGGTGCATAAWTCTAVETANSVGDHSSIAFTPLGVPYVSYYDATNLDLRLAQYVGSGGTGCATAAWTCTAVDSTNDVGAYSSLAFGPNGNAYISYRDATNTYLKLAQYVGSGGTGCATAAWTCINVDTAGDYGWYSSLAFGAGGTPYISHYTGSDIRLAQYVGSGGTGCSGNAAWTCSDHTTTSNQDGFHSSMAVSPAGIPYITHYDFTDGDLRIDSLVRSGDISFSPSTQSGSVTSSHADMTSVSDSGNKSDADCIGGGTWQNGVIATSPEVSINLPAGYCTEIVFTIDTSQASYGATYRFVVAGGDNWRKDKGMWRGPTSVASGAYATLTTGSSSDPVLLRAGKDIESQGTSCATSWTCTTVETEGSEPSLAFSPNGTPYMSYFEGTNLELRLAQYVGSGGTGCASSAWTCTVVDTNGTTGQMSSLAFNSSGVPYISYFDNGGKVKVAQYVGTGGTGCATSSWTCTEVDMDVINQDLGYSTSIAISPGGVPYVTYVDNFTATFKVANYVGSGGNCGSAAWKCAYVDGDATLSSTTSIAFSPAGVPYFSHYDATNFDLRLAQYVGSGGTGCNNPEWTCTNIASTGSVGLRSSLAFSPSGVPYISYYSTTNGDFFVAEYVGSGGTGCAITSWKCTAVDTSSAYGLYNSLAFSPSGVPYASYWDNTNSDLRLAQYVGSGGTGCASTEWKCVSVDTANDSGNFNSMAFSPTGVPFVSYHDGSNQSLRIAKLDVSSEKLVASTQYVNPGNRNGTWSEGRYHLSDGRLGRSAAFGACAGSTTALMGHCGLFNDDGNTDSITALANERPIYNFNFKVKSDSELPTISWVGRTTLAPNTGGSVGDLKLQVYRFGTTKAWVDMDTNSSSADCNTDNCKLSGIPGGALAEYFESDGSDYRIYFRVWQDHSGSTGMTLSTDAVQLQYLSGQMRHGIRFENGIKRPASW